jgi:acyl carrier protein
LSPIPRRLAILAGEGLDSRSMTEDQILKTLLSIVRDVIDDEDIEFGLDTPFVDVPGWDSLNNMHIVVRFEKKVGVEFKQSDFEKITTVGQLVDAALLKLGK